MSGPTPITHCSRSSSGWVCKQRGATDRRGREVVSGRGGAPCPFGPKFRGPREATGVLDLGHSATLCLRSSLRGPGAEERELGEWDSHSIDSNGMNIRTEEQTLPFPYSHSYPIPLPFQRDSASKRASVNPSPAAAMEAKCKCIPDPFSTTHIPPAATSASASLFSFSSLRSASHCLHLPAHFPQPLSSLEAVEMASLKTQVGRLNLVFQERVNMVVVSGSM